MVVLGYRRWYAAMGWGWTVSDGRGSDEWEMEGRKL